MKRYIKVLAIMMILVVSLVGCTNSYTRDTSTGTVEEINLDDSLKMAEQEEAIILYTLSTCKDCKQMKDILLPYLENHSVEIKEVVLDKEGTSDEEIQNNRKKINTMFPEFNSVPSMYYMKDGKIVDEIFEIQEEAELEEWVVKNKLDKE